jgi:hypothetical protein
MSEPIMKGERVYWRRRDLFGIAQADESDGTCSLKLEPPWDQRLPAELAPVDQLMREHEVDAMWPT